jgi:DUF1680 family protein
MNILPSAQRYRPARTRDITLSGWMRREAEVALEGYIGRMPELSSEVGSDVFASGRLGPADKGENVQGVAWWNGESEGNWLLAWFGHVALVGDEAAHAHARERVARIIAAQDEDGYLGMFTAPLRDLHPFITGELWTQACLLRALAAWAEHDDDAELLNKIDRAIDAATARFTRALENETAFTDSSHNGHDLMFVDVLAERNRRLADSELLATAEHMYESYSTAEMEWPFADFQRSILESDAPMVGHGAHAAEHLRVPLLIAEMGGESGFLDLHERGLTKLMPAVGVSGALKSDESISAPGSPALHFAEAGNEFCAMTELVVSLLENVRLTGDLRLLDRVETLISNAAPAGVLHDGRGVVYFMGENQSTATARMGTRWDLSPTHDDAAVCCAPNSGRLLAAVGTRMIVRNDDTYSVQLFGPVSVSFPDARGDVTITQDTAFPFRESISVAVDGNGRRFAVEFRIPGWVSEPEIRVAGARDVSIQRESDRYRVTAQWVQGSIVDLDYRQQPKVVTVPDGRTAVTVGPLLMAVPIEYHETVTREYAVPGFADLDLIPVSNDALYGPLLFKPAEEDIAVHRETDGEPSWREPGITATLGAVHTAPRATALDGAGATPLTLVPIGSTTLRWSVFNAVPR